MALPYRDFPGWLKLVTVLLTLGASWALWHGVHALVVRLSIGGLYTAAGFVIAGLVFLLTLGLLVDRSRKARRPDSVRTLEHHRDRP